MATSTKNKCVLCLDGGGVRGRYSLGICHLLATSMSPQKLSSFFHLIVGVSVGAWVGACIALGLFDEEKSAHRIYQDILLQLSDVMRGKNHFGPAVIETRYDGTGKRAVLKRIFESHKLRDVIVPFAVVCATVGGKPRIFRSWDIHDAELQLVDILDATSAVPIMFPPTQVISQNASGIPQTAFFIDGGVVNNKPVIIAATCAIELFGTANPLETMKHIRMVSIGTHAIVEIQIESDMPSQMGLITWMGLGIFDILTGIAEDTDIQFLHLLLGPNRFLRVHCECGQIKMDDLSEQAISKLESAISFSWVQHGNDLQRFLSNTF